MLKKALVWILISFASIGLANTAPSDRMSQLVQEIKNVKTQKDLNDIFSFFHPDVLIILENGKTFNSLDDLKDYINQPIYFNDIKVKELQIKSFNIEKPINLSPESVLASGKIRVKYVLSNTKNLELNSHWAATLVKQNDQWLIRSYQGTSDIFNNPIVDITRYDYYLVFFVTLIIGAILGYFWKRIRVKK